MQVGIGYDIHRITKDRNLILGGVLITEEFGLKGHSDGDVLIHSIIDALLGAAALGDIGEYFPDTDKKYKNIASTKLLKEVIRILSRKKLIINNIDTIIITEVPKLQPFYEKIRNNLSKILKIDKAKISIKAKTNEKLGEIGKGKAIAAFAVVSIKKG